MTIKYLLVAIVAFVLSPQAIAQEPAQQAPAVTAPAPDKLPPAPDKSLKRQIWEGYYNALLNTKYHLRRSVIMTEASSDTAKHGRAIAVIAVIMPFTIATLLLQHAVKQKAESKKLIATLGPAGITIVVYCISGWGLWYGLESAFAGSAEQTRAQLHKELYRDWNALAAQWQDLHDISLKGEPDQILRPQYTQLHALQEAIKGRETPDLYDAGLHRQVQADLDEYLIEDAKRVRG